MSVLAGLLAGVEWPIVALLAGTVLWEELRQVPPGATVFRAVLGLPFEPVTSRPGRRLVGLWPPLTTTIIVPPPSPESDSAPALTLAERWAVVGRYLVLFRLLAGASLLLLVLGVPLAAAWLGGVGLLVTLGVTVAVAGLNAFLAYRVTGLAGVPTKRRRWPSLGLLSPFAAPRVAEVVLELVMRGETVPAVAAALMEPGAFRGWVRPQAYDALQGGETDRELDAVLSTAEQRSLVESVPENAVAGEGYCPRCGATYLGSAGACARCGVRLETVGRLGG